MVHAPARKESSRDFWPVIPAGVLVDFWSASKFTPDNDADILFHSTIVQILHEGGYALIKQRKVLAGTFEVSTVPIPAAESEGHAAGTGLHESAGHEELIKSLPRAVCGEFFGSLSVALDNVGILFTEVEGLCEAA